MISDEDYKRINEIVSADNARQIITEIINIYGLQSPDNASFIMTEAANVSVFMMNHYGEKAAQYKIAATHLMREGVAPADTKDYLLYLLRICMPAFPDGIIKPENTNDEKRFFNQLITLLSPPSRVFNWKRKEDWKWAKTNGVRDYLIRMQYQNASLR